ncbi:hypothetical protein HMPREF2983_00385 [Prevotella sp. HMSC077E09]|uniref:hypothetical protein n=1 Tax=Prevotella sp. HMSC077E09 TaxID=1739487 RepID=UPI0008A62684|nr:MULTISPECIES: hypothetical protein [unclassified Prevotella]OFO73635.1 hypothetical protein HMPREF3018_01095 [Prevotella sp. HMSC077E08]OFP61343.1 hypothetical protein HMPREF2983_00385 [Prevotella sp. HMSC077E09]
MVNYVDIENTLNYLDSTYLASMSDPLLPILLSKTALIEFSGWIEQSMDQILYDYLDSHICETYIIKYIKDQIKKNYGFKYENNILRILSITIGAYNLENVLNKININLLKTLLDKYSNKRNNAAHTHTLGTTTTYDAPSVILNDFKCVKPIITAIEHEVQSLP